jgi:hypothetical protein
MQTLGKLLKERNQIRRMVTSEPLMQVPYAHLCIVIREMIKLPYVTGLASALSRIEFRIADLAEGPAAKGSLARSTTSNPNSFS